ncbi:RNA-directed DNA polymerase, eukaryota, reverse transcriptase zinc-binding domain protein [Tanacetum coccineum]
MGKQFVNTDQNGWTWITRNKKSKPIGNPYHKDLENIATSFYVTNMPPALTSKGLWNVCASHGRLVDAFIANKLSKRGKRFGFIKFLGVKDANYIVGGLPLCAWGSMAYKKIASSFGKFLFFEKEESTALSSGRLCISTKSHQLISETVQVDIKNESFEVSVQEIGSWSTKIKDDYNDISPAPPT